MLSHLSTVCILALSVLAMATPHGQRRWGASSTITSSTVSSVSSVSGSATSTASATTSSSTATTSGQCTVAPIQCCEQVEPAGTPEGAYKLKEQGLAVHDPNTLVATSCSPFTGVGVGSEGTCTATPVCCTDNSHSLISIGCVIILL